MRFTVLLFIGFFYFAFFALRFTLATTMSSQNYSLQGELNSGGGSTTNSQYKLQWNLDQAIGNDDLFISAASSSSSLSLSISQSLIDFGVLSPTNPVTRGNRITVSAGGNTGFSLVSYEDKPLTAKESSVPIPDTTCDDGFCNEVKASNWISPLTYGFGYRCDNQTQEGCVPDFSTDSVYKQFSDNSKKESPQVVMRARTQGTYSSQITYKITASPLQPPGRYSNVITYIVSPSF